MPWLQIAFACTPDQAPTLSDLLTEAGAVAVTFVDAGDEPKYQPSTEPTDFWSQTIVTGMFQEGTEPSKIIGFLSNHLETCPEHTIALLEDEDWERSWMDRFQPMKFGNNLWICPSWREPVDSGATNIFVDPGLAFGTGTHASTAMCLEWLDNHPPTGQEIVDYGCGSGVLAI
ncbi:MAG: 50S ribosomal protein L11 methyltransferase, partial [Gammaproteobacteria bacterium]|nr:50S ribosomal protein L11 methyltransferase [Gammaproteobacteria bacterium]